MALGHRRDAFRESFWFLLHLPRRPGDFVNAGAAITRVTPAGHLDDAGARAPGAACGGPHRIGKSHCGGTARSPGDKGTPLELEVRVADAQTRQLVGVVRVPFRFE